MTETAAGRRTVPHTADLRVEAWAATREDCIAQAVLGAVESFVDIVSAHPTRTRRCRFPAEADEDLLVDVLEEVVYLLDTAGEVPVDVEIEPVEDADGSVDVRFAMVAAAGLPQVGAVPKAVSLHELRLGRGPRGWRCSVTLDV
jgi:SHS2 domain-containing protein